MCEEALVRPIHEGFHPSEERSEGVTANMLNFNLFLSLKQLHNYACG